MAVRQRRTQTERREESERRLLTAAAEIIATEGFAAASFDRIGQAAGYSRGLASQKFGSKDGLVEAVIDFVQIRMDAATTKALQAATTPVEEVLAYVEATLMQIEQDYLARSYFVMMAAAIANRLPIQSAFLAQHDLFRLKVRRIIERGLADGSVRQGIDADAAAISVGGMTLGIATQLLLDPKLDMAAVRTASLMAVSRALGSRDATVSAAQPEEKGSARRRG
ncbi:MAG: TetR/AcrR family transcriptional regulator [Sphingobium sp.]